MSVCSPCEHGACLWLRSSLAVRCMGVHCTVQVHTADVIWCCRLAEVVANKLRLEEEASAQQQGQDVTNQLSESAVAIKNSSALQQMASYSNRDKQVIDCSLSCNIHPRWKVGVQIRFGVLENKQFTSQVGSLYVDDAHGCRHCTYKLHALHTCCKSACSVALYTACATVMLYRLAVTICYICMYIVSTWLIKTWVAHACRINMWYCKTQHCSTHPPATVCWCSSWR